MEFDNIGHYKIQGTKIQGSKIQDTKIQGTKIHGIKIEAKGLGEPNRGAAGYCELVSCTLNP